MELEMYLEARRGIAPGSSQTEPMRRAIGAAIGYVPSKQKPGRDASLLEICGVTVRVGYWRNFGPLHRWFELNARAGQGDCRSSRISENCLQRLSEVCERVIAKPERVVEHFNMGSATELDVKEFQYTLDILSHAISLQEQGWDMYYRASR